MLGIDKHDKSLLLLFLQENHWRSYLHSVLSKYLLSQAHFNEGRVSSKASGNVLCRKIRRAIFFLF